MKHLYTMNGTTNIEINPEVLTDEGKANFLDEHGLPKNEVILHPPAIGDFVFKFVKTEYDADEIALLDKMADEFMLEAMYENGNLQPEDI